MSVNTIHFLGSDAFSSVPTPFMGCIRGGSGGTVRGESSSRLLKHLGEEDVRLRFVESVFMADSDGIMDGVIRRISFVIKIDPKPPMSFFLCAKIPGYSCVFIT